MNAIAPAETTPRPGTRRRVTAGLDDQAAIVTDTALWLRTEGDFDRHPHVMAHLGHLAEQVREEAQSTGVYSEIAGRLVATAADLVAELGASREDIRTVRDHHADVLDWAAAILLGARILTQNGGAR